jgi:hypothetical protein
VKRNLKLMIEIMCTFISTLTSCVGI